MADPDTAVTGRGPLAPSGYVDVDNSPDPSVYVERLASTGASDFQRALAAQSLAWLGLRPGNRALEVGCGMGRQVMEMATVVGSTGEAVGVDRSQVMIEASRCTAPEHSACVVRFVRAEALHLPFEDGFFDACRVMRTLLHIDDAYAAVAEMKRVTRPGGRIVMVEPDYGAAVIEGGDPEVTQRLVVARVAHFAQGRAGLWLAGWAAKAGLRVVAQTRLLNERTGWTAATEHRYRQKYIAPALALNTVSPAEAERWLADLRCAAESNRFAHRAFVTVLSAVRV